MTNSIAALGSSAVNAVNTARVAIIATQTGTRQHLTSEQLAHARAFLLGRGMPADHLENVVFIKGMVGHGWIVDRARENNNPAITRGNVVYVRDDFWATATDPNRETFWSEIFHTSQYQLGNFESNYLSGVIGSIMIGGDGHVGNIMETIAHNRGADMATTWSAKHR
jgi:hypothetical protein